MGANETGTACDENFQIVASKAKKGIRAKKLLDGNSSWLLDRFRGQISGSRQWSVSGLDSDGRQFDQAGDLHREIEQDSEKTEIESQYRDQHHHKTGLGMFDQPPSLPNQRLQIHNSTWALSDMGKRFLRRK